MKAMLRRNQRAQFGHFARVELDDATAAAADHVIVRVAAVGVFVVHLLIREMHFFYDTTIDQELERAIDGGLGDAFILLPHHEQQLLGLEMFIGVHDGADDLLALGGVFEAAIAQEFPKDVFGRPHEFFAILSVEAGGHGVHLRGWGGKVQTEPRRPRRDTARRSFVDA